MTHKECIHAFDYRADGKLIWKTPRSHKISVGDESGCLAKYGYLKTGYNGKTYLTHRVIWFWHHGEWPKIIDHINGVKTDNRIENLKNVSLRENCSNKICHRKGKLVGTQAAGKKFNAKIKHNGKTIYLGTYNSEKEAASVYLKAAKKIEKFGEL